MARMLTKDELKYRLDNYYIHPDVKEHIQAQEEEIARLSSAYAGLTLPETRKLLLNAEEEIERLRVEIDRLEQYKPHEQA